MTASVTLPLPVLATIVVVGLALVALVQWRPGWAASLALDADEPEREDEPCRYGIEHKTEQSDGPVTIGGHTYLQVDDLAFDHHFAGRVRLVLHRHLGRGLRRSARVGGVHPGRAHASSAARRIWVR